MLKTRYYLTITTFFFQVFQFFGLGVFSDLSDLIRALFSQLSLVFLIFIFDATFPLTTRSQRVIKGIISFFILGYLSFQFFVRPVTERTLLIGHQSDFLTKLGLQIFAYEAGLTRSLYLLTILVSSLWLSIQRITFNKDSVEVREILFKVIKKSHLFSIALVFLILEAILPISPKGYPSRALNPFSFQLFFSLQKKKEKNSLPDISDSESNSLAVLIYTPGLSHSMLNSKLMMETKKEIKNQSLSIKKWVFPSRISSVPLPQLFHKGVKFKDRKSFLFYQGHLTQENITELKSKKGIDFIVSSENPEYSDEVIFKNILGFLKKPHSKNPLVIGHLKSLMPPFKFGHYIEKKATAIKNFDNLLASFLKTLKRSHPEVQIAIVSDHAQILFGRESPFKRYENVFIHSQKFPLKIEIFKDIDSFQDTQNLRQVWHKGGKLLKYCSTHFANPTKCEKP